MSEPTTPVVEEPTAVTAENLAEELNKLKATNERLLAESKEYKQKFTTLKTSIDDSTKKKLEADQDWKSLLEKEQIEKQALNSSLIQMKKQTLRKALDFEVAKYAKDAFDVEDVIGSLDKDAITIDEESLSINGVEGAVNALRAKKSYLFNSGKKPAMVDDRPSFNEPKKPEKKLTINENIATLKDLMMQNQ